MKIMAKYIVLLLLCSLFSTGLGAQQLPVFNQYTELQNYLNPAGIPVDYLQYNQTRVAGISFRRQWVNIKDAPATGLAHFNYIREDANLSVFGGLLVNDQTGPTGTTGLYARYSYQIRPSTRENLLIGFGLSAGLVQHRARAAELQFDPDDLLSGIRQGNFLPDFGMGINVVYYPEKGRKYYAGLSMPQTAGIRAKFKGLGGSDLSIQQAAHIYLNGGVIFPSGQNGFIEPSFWLKYAPNVPMHLDINIRQKFANNFWIGGGYSTSNAIRIETGIILTQLLRLENSLVRVGYSFDYNISSFGNVFGTSHELTVSYAWN
jgi:type IX secretion system PorP/SprF family membrane protein